MMGRENAPPVAEVVFNYSRVLNAPRELVFKVYTEREHLAHWWGPKGFALTIEKFEPKEGGIFHYKMAVPNGFEMWGKWVIREITAPERLVFVSTFSDPAGGIAPHPMSADWPMETLCITTFESLGDKTKVSIQAIPIDAEDIQRKTFLDGFDSMNGGYGGMFDNLEDYLKSLS